ncbi:hypothetical protein OHO83_08885 [Streptomyces sp. NBC_00569]|uniref:hypothetical protein n=1 Tax=Streptomyces sp. NBC_00569 TaxID=2975780 RepID=UPI002E7FD3A0|nr:hypothetical protein [Streptomyces sp. NBC_00569]WUB92422.1 hypothetical protein OHO83_08885 [Streptomyces sp. NBC_00569]
MSEKHGGFGGTIQRGPMACDVIGAQYTTVFNLAVRDRRLSRRARGLLVELLSHRDGFGVSLAMLLRNGPEGKDALTVALRELEAHGYLHRERERDARGRLGEARYYLTDMPAGVEIVAQAPWTTRPSDTDGGAGGGATLVSRSRRSHPKPEIPHLDDGLQTPSSEPKSGFPAQAEPPQENLPPKKNNLKKTNEENTSPFLPSASRPRENRGGKNATTTRRGEKVLLSIARHHPELHAALATGTTLADQAPLAGRLLEGGVSREHIREALVGRPYPAPEQRTHSLAALVAARLQQLKLLAVAADRARDNWKPPQKPTGAPALGAATVDLIVPKPECPGQDGLCGRPVDAPGDLCTPCARFAANAGLTA